MNVLLVDDQQLIVTSLVNGIKWKEHDVEKVYSCTSVQEAKLILTNYPVDLLITDIEMPEENGVSLAEWTREQFGNSTLIVFLTSHPSFSYAQDGVKLHIFDYLLQPVRFADLEDCVERAGKEIASRRVNRHLQKVHTFLGDHRNAIFDTIVMKAFSGNVAESRKLFSENCQIYQEQYGDCFCFLAYLEVRQFALVHEKWSDELLRSTFCNVLSDLFADVHAEAYAASVSEGEYFLFVFTENEEVPESEAVGRFETFVRFFNCRTSPKIRVAADPYPEVRDFVQGLGALKNRLQNGDRGKDLLLYDDENSGYGDAGLVQQAESFIRENIFRKITRADVADHVHLNADYFSRLFRKETGLSFKDYVLKEKMKKAADMLAHTKFSVGIIASKMGFDNFSHFSHTFKNYYYVSPQDYRNENGGSK